MGPETREINQPENVARMGKPGHALKGRPLDDDGAIEFEKPQISGNDIADEIEQQRNDEAWMHAACLTIAETGQKWGDSVHPSLAMSAVYNLRRDRDWQFEVLTAHRRFHHKAGCPGRPECYVCAAEEWFYEQTAFNVPVMPSLVAKEIAARVWCDQEMRNCVMDVGAAEEIAVIVDRVRHEQSMKQSYVE